MTGQGQASRQFRSGTVEVELRAVNNRFLKVSTRISDAVAAIEPEVEAILRPSIRRGSISVSIATTGIDDQDGTQINVAVLTKYLKQASEAVLAARWSGTVGDFLSLPGVVETGSSPDNEGDDYLQPVRDCLAAAIEDLQAMRLREGLAMAQQFHVTLDAFRGEIEKIRANADNSVKDYELRLETKVRQAQERLGLSFEPADIVREVTLFADKSDICEEIVRFISHIDQMKTLLHSDEPAGRKLEFLIQEMHREANTMGSKSSDSTIAACVIEIKTLIEQLREIVQNVE